MDLTNAGGPPVEQGHGYRCTRCGEVVPTRDGEALFECGKCAHLFSRSNSLDGKRHWCPECAGMGRKISDYACPRCEQGALEEL